MKKTKKKDNKKIIIFIVTAAIAISIICVLGARADGGFGGKIFNSYSDTYDKSSSLYTMIRQGYNEGTKGPMSIVKGRLDVDTKDDTNSYDVYLIMLSGTEVFAGQANDVKADVLSALESSNDYLTNVVDNIEKNIKKGSNLFLAGHSLGGMVAQQLGAEPKIKENYNVLYTITYGAPPLNKIDHEGRVNRLGDTSDVVPFLSINGIISLITKEEDVQKEDGGYDNQINAHRMSYGRDDVWGKYDVLGIKDGKSSFSFDKSKIKFYKCPKIEEKKEDKKDN